MSDGIEQALLRIEQRLDGMQQELARTRAELGQTRTEFANALAQTRAEFSKALAQTSADFMQELARTRGDIMARIDRLQTDLADTRQVADVGFNVADYRRKFEREFRERLDDQDNLIGQIMRLVQSIRARIDDLEQRHRPPEH